MGEAGRYLKNRASGRCGAESGWNGGDASAIECPILDRLGEMLGADVVGPREVGDRARHLEQPVKGPGGESEAEHRGAQQLLGGAIEPAVAPHLARAHVRVRVQARMRDESPLLSLARGLYARADRRARLLALFAGQIGRGHGRHPELEIDPVEQRPRDPAQIALHLERIAATGAHRVALMAAGASPRCLSAMCISMHKDHKILDTRKSLPLSEMHS